jgi:hypothetical protein
MCFTGSHSPGAIVSVYHKDGTGVFLTAILITLTSWDLFDVHCGSLYFSRSSASNFAHPARMSASSSLSLSQDAIPNAIAKTTYVVTMNHVGACAIVDPTTMP